MMFESSVIPLLITLLLFAVAFLIPCHGDAFKKLDRIIFALIAFALSVVAWGGWVVWGFVI